MFVCYISLISVKPATAKKFSNRTHNCGELNGSHDGCAVTLCGWIESKQGKFIQIRDGYGIVQAVVKTENVSSHLNKFTLRI